MKVLRSAWMAILPIMVMLSTQALGASNETMPESWYITINQDLVDRVKKNYTVDVTPGIYYENQRKAWYRDDVSRASLIHFDAFEWPAFGEGLTYIGYAEKTFGENKELWLIKPNQEKFMIASLDMTASKWTSHLMMPITTNFFPIRGGLMAINEDGKVRFVAHTPSEMEDAVINVKAFIDPTSKKAVLRYNVVTNTIVMMGWAEGLPEEEDPGVYLIHPHESKVTLLDKAIKTPLFFGEHGVYFDNAGDKLFFRSIDWSGTATELLGAAKTLYTLRSSAEEAIDKFDFRSDGVFVMAKNPSGRLVKYSIDREGHLQRYKGESSKFRASTAQDDELMRIFEHKEFFSQLRRGAKTPLYELPKTSQFLRSGLGAEYGNWTVLRYNKGQKPTELVASFIWQLQLQGLNAPKNLDLDRVWVVNAEQVFDTTDENELNDRLQNLRDVVEKRKAILVMEDFATTLKSEAPRVIPVLQKFYKTFRPCLNAGTCRVVMTTREEVYRKFYEVHEDILRNARSYIVPTLEKADRIEVAERAREQQERLKRIRIEDDAFDFVLSYAGGIGQTQASPGNELDMMRDLYTFVDTFYPEIDLITRQIGRDWVAHLRGVHKDIDLDGLEAYLLRRVVGHDAAIKAIVDSLKPIKYGTHFGRQPLAFHTLIGTPGIGKTYIAKLIADFLTGRDSLLMVDMRTFNGFDQNHPIRHALSSSQNEMRVVLFDDVDQVGPKQIDLLAGIVEEGRYAEGANMELSFSNTIILWTANWGEQVIRDHGASSSSLKEKLRRHLTEPGQGSKPIMKRRIWSRIESRLQIMMPFTDIQLVELARLMSKEHADEVYDVLGVKLTFDPRLLLQIVAYEAEVRAGARSIKEQLRAQLYTKYQDTIADPDVTHVILLQVNNEVEVFSNLDPDFAAVEQEVQKYTKMTNEQLVEEFGDD